MQELWVVQGGAAVRLSLRCLLALSHPATVGGPSFTNPTQISSSERFHCQLRQEIGLALVIFLPARFLSILSSDSLKTHVHLWWIHMSCGKTNTALSKIKFK